MKENLSLFKEQLGNWIIDIDDYIQDWMTTKQNIFLDKRTTTKQNQAKENF